MTRKIIKYILSGALLIFLCYNAVYFKKLDEVKKEAIVTKFDAAKFAGKYYQSVLPVAAGSIEFNSLLSLLKTNPARAFKEHGHALGIGNIKYFLVQGKATIQKVNESSVTVLVKADSTESQATIATEFVYGNAIRDASGIIRLKAFSNTADLNNVSAEVNRIVREKVLPPFLAEAKAGDAITFSGAIELNQKFLNTNGIEIMPVELNIIPK